MIPDMLRPTKSVGTVRAHSLPRRNRFEYTETETDGGEEQVEVGGDRHQHHHHHDRERLSEVEQNSPFPIENTRAPHRVSSSPRLRLDNRRADLTGGSLIKKLLGTSFMAKSLTKPVHGFPVHKPTTPTAPSPDSPWDRFILALHTFATALGAITFTKENIGSLSAWCCTCLYVSSRCPQIYRNFCNKSTKGILMYLFLFAMLGNTFYATSVVTDLYVLKLVDPTLYNKEVLVRLPFIIGSAGTVTFDIVILMQVWYYSSPTSLHNSHHYHQHHQQRQQQQYLQDNHQLHHQQQQQNHQFHHHPQFQQGISPNNSNNNQLVTSHPRNQSYLVHRTPQDSPSSSSNRRLSKFPYTDDYYSTLYDDENDQIGEYMGGDHPLKRRSKHTHEKSLETFQKPDWYTNIYKNPHTSSPNNNNDESTKLVNQFTQSYKNYVNASPQLNPPSHYISGSASLARSINVSSHSNIISNAFNMLASSMSSSSMNNENDYYNIPGSSLKNHHSASTNNNGNIIINNNSITNNIVSNSVTSSHLATSIIPSIVGNYSSLSRKMKDETKIPFSPSDFLNDEFYHSTAGTLGNTS
ncbi:uncharacterized protein KQ657_001590 [Scheffersomyces spartinae]|uniref:Uncharacterized protein n=1 Tax=Scheffersomyces spartinae TaxID=45513 RepID=A0A9P7V777_9ASCO|nr:uncharacterized protein KQ657_001590 [Scheffersomyces spartinae]KAG7192495.1 hypothetical protein KQ657_001590 [Scheffersomyces spartinae]